MKKQLPVYEMVIDEDPEAVSEVNFVALVDRPAIQKDFMAFAEQKPMCFHVVSEDKRIVSGPAMLSDTPIYRNQDGEEFYVVFTKDTIEKIALKFFKKGYQANFNLMHEEALQTQNVVIFESFITDKERGISPMRGYQDAPEGSWFISAKVEDDAVWQLIKEGKVKGFSVEGIFGYKATPKTLEEGLISQLEEILSQCPEN